jgi:hypothetical protein
MKIEAESLAFGDRLGQAERGLFTLTLKNRCEASSARPINLQPKSSFFEILLMVHIGNWIHIYGS